MEYGTEICLPCDLPCDDNYTKYVGYSESNSCIQQYYSENTRRIISRKITELLQGVDPHNRPIIVPDKSVKVAAPFSKVNPFAKDKLKSFVSYDFFLLIGINCMYFNYK